MALAHKTNYKDNRATPGLEKAIYNAVYREQALNILVAMNNENAVKCLMDVFRNKTKDKHLRGKIIDTLLRNQTKVGQTELFLSKV